MTRFATLAVLLASGVLFLFALGSRSLISEEVRWAEIAREMVSSGDYWRPTINEKTYFDKPVGSYWLIVGLSRLTGTVDEFTARLPAALAGLLGVALVISLGRKIFGVKTGVLAGAILATNLGYVIYSRRATADLETVTGVLLAVWWFHRNRDRTSFVWVLPLWLGMAFVSLTKGLLGFALPLVIFVGFGLVTAWVNRPRPWALRPFIGTYLKCNRWFFNGYTLLAMPLAVVVYFLPFTLADQGTGTGLDMVWRENVKRFVSPHNHVGPVYLYLGVIFILAAPWSLFLPAALFPQKPSQSNDQPGERLIRVAFFSLFLFFTASASRRSYYLLPILPYASLLIATLLTREPTQLHPIASVLRRLAWCLLVILFVASGLALLPIHWFLPKSYAAFPGLPNQAWLAMGWTIGMITLAWLLITKKTIPLTYVVAGVFIGLIYAFGLAYPSFDRIRPRNDFLQIVHDETQPAPEQLALYHCSDIVFDLGRLVRDYDQDPSLAEAIRQKKVRWIVAPSHLAKFGFPARIVAEEATLPWESEDRTENKLVLLEFVNK
ncbi:MAG: glycosyltransferase family 39 protein [Gemmataceae bacterium]